MLPYLAAFCHGLAKSTALHALGVDCPCKKCSRPIGGREVGRTLVSAGKEELIFRLIPDKLGVPPAVATVAFGLAHVDMSKDQGHNAYRIPDATIGGMVYDSAYKQHGIVGSTIAHAIHNLATRLK